MGVNNLPKTVTRERRSCDLNPGPSASESSTLTTRQPSHPSCFKLLEMNILFYASERRGFISGSLCVLQLLCCPGGSVAEWLACWTEAQKDPGSNRSRDAVG